MGQLHPRTDGYLEQLLPDGPRLGTYADRQ